MKRILSLTLICMLSLTLVSAGYNYDYNKPSLDRYSHQLFTIAKSGLIPTEAIKTMYAILTTARFYEDKLIRCEVKLKLEERKKSSGGHSHTNIVYIESKDEEINNSNGDASGDGIIDNVDEVILQNNYGRQGCKKPSWCSGADFNHDGAVDLKDLGILAENI